MKVLIAFLKLISYFSLWGVAICGLYFVKAVFPFTVSSIVNAVICGLFLYGVHRFMNWVLAKLSPKAAS